MFFEYWPHVRYTGFGQALRIMAHDLFGVEEISPETFAELNENAVAFPHEGYYESMLRDRANISRVCRIVWPGAATHCDLDLMFPVPVFDHFASVLGRADLHSLEEETDTEIRSLDDLEDALDVAFERRLTEGMVGVKVFFAYRRTLDFEPASRADAERIFQRASLSHGDTPVGFDEAKPLQDYMIARIVQAAADRDLPVQIHTGYTNDNGNYLGNTRPTHLDTLLMRFPEATFVLLHGGWPYSNEFVALAKKFPNVYADMAWTYILGHGAAERLLTDLLDSVPANKILGFGGDYDFAEGAYAHARLARRSIRHVLADKVEHGYMEEEEAVDVAALIMHDNAAELYGFAGGE